MRWLWENRTGRSVFVYIPFQFRDKRPQKCVLELPRENRLFHGIRGAQILFSVKKQIGGLHFLLACVVSLTSPKKVFIEGIFCHFLDFFSETSQMLYVCKADSFCESLRRDSSTAAHLYAVYCLLQVRKLPKTLAFPAWVLFSTMSVREGAKRSTVAPS